MTRRRVSSVIGLSRLTLTACGKRGDAPSS